MSATPAPMPAPAGPATSGDAPLTADHVEVAIPVPLRRVFSYKVPDSLRGQLRPGHRVAVSFGRRKVFGFVLGPAAYDPGIKYKRVLGLLGRTPVFDPELLGFLQGAAQYYLHPVGEVLRAAAPAMPKEAVEALRRSGQLSAEETFRGTQLRTRKDQFVRFLRAEAELENKLRGQSQRAVMALVEERGELPLSELRRHVRNPLPVVRALLARGAVEVEERDVAENPFFSSPIARDEPPRPNPEQAAAIEAIVAGLARGGGFLLHGVTGSGKTEVYLQVIARALQQGRGALVLVPEIALTPQLVSRFRARFGDELAVLHSELGERARDDAWRSLREGRVRIAIGARSALFAPIERLGAVIVDEEHDSSFKQEDGFRYHARDMALYRAHRAGAVCVLGSATPALESLQLSRTDRLVYLRLRERATSQTLPEVEVVDLNRHRSGPTGHRLLSAPLYRALQACLEAQDQAILFLNRRGFSPALRCDSCGEIQECPACSVALTAHRAAGSLRCHYCDFERPQGGPCSHCQAPTLLELGLGTEQLEAMLAEAFPAARVARLDRDTAAGRGVEAVLDRLRRHETDILVGTQMVTKGHDLPGVTLVGVILADQSLAFPDFRASERTFQLLAQVAGRAGRGDRPGRVVLQTYQPEQPSVRFARSHDYDGFCEVELSEREALRYPPFSRLVAVRVDAESDAGARRAVELLAQVAARHPEVLSERVQVLGPAPAPILKLRSRFRYRFLLRGTARPAVRAVARTVASRIDEGLPDARASVDIDPVNML